MFVGGKFKNTLNKLNCRDKTKFYLKFVLQIFDRNLSLFLFFFISSSVCFSCFSFFKAVTLLHFIPAIAPDGIHSCTTAPYTHTFLVPALTIFALFLFHPCCPSNPQAIFVS
jgi:hypothetical protein